MIMAVRVFVLLLFSGITSVAIAQGPRKSQPGSASFEFRDGVYINMGMLRKNSPIPSTWIETEVDPDDRDFYKKNTRDKEIVFFDDNGVRTIIITDSIWGYSHRGDLHINIYGDFHKIDQIGRYSHFIARKATYVEYEVRGFHPRSISFLTFEAIAKNTAYLVDMVGDRILVFDAPRLEELLMEDPELWNEFIKLRKRKREKMKYVFLLRYNSKYPLEIPFEPERR